MERVSLAIEGMSCGHCVSAVDRALRSVPGVQVEHVGIGSAAVAYDPEVVDQARIAEVIVEEGYRVHVRRAEP